MVKVVAHVTARAGHEKQLERILKGLLGPTRMEPGCRFYDLHVGADPQIYTFIEAWETDDDLDLHLSSPHIEQAMIDIKDHVVGAPDIRRYVQIG